jgi:hypothetical protein
MVYIGYPVNIKEALRLFNLPKSEDSFEYSYQCIEYIHKETQKYGLEFRRIDKNLHVIGLECNDFMGCLLVA